MVDQTEQQASLEAEQAIVDDQEDRIAELVEHIRELGVESPLAARLSTPTASRLITCLGVLMTWRVTCAWSRKKLSHLHPVST